MKIRSKLSWTFILLLIFGITAVSSYAILFIRNYMLEEGVEQIEKDARWMEVTMRQLNVRERLRDQVAVIGRSSDYQVVLYNREGRMLTHYPDTMQTPTGMAMGDDIRQTLLMHSDSVVVRNLSEMERIFAYARISGSSHPAQFVRISQYKERIYQPIKTIRWIIYYGMFISIGLVIIVSLWISRSLTKPITRIKDAAREIADGDLEREIHLDRKDEFGTLARSLNRMASTLRADNEELKRINERQRQFFADITHELKNPLHTLMGSLEMLEVEGLDEKQRNKYLEKIRGQAERIDRLFRDLVTLQRYESDKYFVEKKVFNLGKICKDLQRWHEDRAEKKGLDLEVKKASQEVVGDPDKIGQVLDNLVSNAIKYTSEGRVTVDYQLTDDEQHVEVKISDTGPGIDPEHQQRLFDRFYRTDKARSRDRGGTGLGLAVVKSILDAHDTRIELDSTRGEGTTFRFHLPAG